MISTCSRSFVHSFMRVHTCYLRAILVINNNLTRSNELIIITPMLEGGYMTLDWVEFNLGSDQLHTYTSRETVKKSHHSCRALGVCPKDAPVTAGPWEGWSLEREGEFGMLWSQREAKGTILEFYLSIRLSISPSSPLYSNSILTPLGKSIFSIPS